MYQPKTIIRSNVTTSNLQSKFGATSIRYPASGSSTAYAYVPSIDSLNISDFGFGTGDFTVEKWLYQTQTTVISVLFDTRTTTASSQSNLRVEIDSSGNIVVIRNQGVILTSTVSTQLNIWQHIVIVRNNGVLKIFIDGIERGSVSFTADLGTTAPFTIGSGSVLLSFDNPLRNAFIDELRVTKGFARYTSNFEPQSTAFVDDDVTVLLLHADGVDGGTTFIDDDSNRLFLLQQQYYIESGYYDTAGYYVYTAEIIERLSSSFSVIIPNIIVEKTTTATLQSSTNLITTISHTQGADLAAFSNASMQVSPQVIKQSNATLQFTANLLSLSNVIIPFSSNLSANFLQTITVNKILNANVDQLANFQQIVDFDKIIELSATLDSAFTPTLVVDAIRNSFAVLEINTAAEITAQRSRSAIAELQAQTVFDSTVEILTPQGEVKDFQAQLLSTTAVFVDSNLIKNTLSLLNFAFDITAVNDRIRIASSQQSLEFAVEITASRTKDTAVELLVESQQVTNAIRTKDTAVELLVESQQVTNAIRTKDTAANMSAEFALLSSAGRIQQAQCNFEALFTPSFTANAVINTFAILDSTAALATVATANRSADVALASIINLSLQGDKVTGYVVNAESQFQQTADNLRTRNQSAQLHADFAVLAVNDRSRADTATMSADFAQTADNGRIRSSDATVLAVTTLDADVKEIVQLSADIAATANVVTALSIEKQFTADLGSLFTPSVSIDGTLNTFAVLDSVATMNVTAVKTTVTAIEVAAQAQQSTVGLRIRPYVSNAVTGIHVNRTVQLTYVDNDLDIFTLQNAVFSFWAKRDEIRNRQVLLDHSRYQLTNSNFFPFRQQYVVLESFNLALENSNFRLYGYSQGGTGAPNSSVDYTWTNVNNDFEWHHYLVTTRFEGIGSGRRLVTTLYRDGVEFSTQNIFAWYYGVNFGTTLNLGHSGEVNGFPYIYGAVSGPEISANTRLNGSIAQLWVGTVLPSNFNINNYYNNGYVATLPDTVVIYDDLATLPNNSLVGTNNQGNTIPVNQENFGNNTYSIQGPLSSQALINIVPRAGLFNIASVSAQFGSTIVARVIGDNQVVASSEFTQSPAGDRIRFAQLSETVESQATIDAVKTVPAQISMQSTVEALITDTKTVSAQAEFTATTQATAQENRILTTTVDINSEFAQTTNISRTKQFAAELAGFAAVIQVTSKIAGFFVNCDVAATMEIVATTSVDNSAELGTDSDIEITARKITDITANVSANSVQTTDALRFRSTVEEFDVTVTMTVATEFSKITRTGAAEYVADFTQSTVTDTSKIINTGPAVYTSEFTQSLTPDLFKRYTAQLNSNTASDTTAVKTVSASAEFDSIATKLVEGTALSYDRALTLTVPGEFRTLTVHEEPLILMVEPETRVNMVRKTA